MKYEDARQRDQIKQALRSHKQNIVEGSSERSLSRKLNLYDVSKSSAMEALEDFEDILSLEHLPRWKKDDPRLQKLRRSFEGYQSSNPSIPPIPSNASKVSEVLGGLDGKEATEAVANYLIDLLIRSGYFMDKLMNSLEEKHQREGGYHEKLLRNRLRYRSGRI